MVCTIDLSASFAALTEQSLSDTACLDSFNVLNSDKTTSVSQRWGDYWYAYWNHPEESEWVGTDSFGSPTSIQQPRTVRLGAKFTF